MASDTLAERITAYLQGRGRADLVATAREAAERAERIAESASVSMEQAQDAPWLTVLAHTVPEAERVSVAETEGVVLTPADRDNSEVVAARLSAHLAQRDLGVSDRAVLDAVRHAPTLRYGAADVEKVVFLAWRADTADVPSLDVAVFNALDELRANYQRHGQRPHPDVMAAWTEAAERLGRLPAAWLALEDSVKWDGQGLLAAVVQDADTRTVLTVAYMNRVALRLCLATGETHFWSRSRREIWHKGRTSGHTQRIAAMSLDCDRDAILVAVHPHGPACHTGAVSCFFTPVLADESLSPFETSTGA